MFFLFFYFFFASHSHQINFTNSGGASSKVVVEPHRHAGVFIARGKEDMLCTRNMVPGESVYGEKRVSVDVSAFVKPEAWLLSD